MNLGIIIQARMGSKRLPGKILRVIHDRPLLDHMLGRLKRLEHDTMVVIATTTVHADDAVEKFCIERGVCCFRGNELNVLKRYYDCAKNMGFSQIVRLTGDNPFTDIEELDQLIELHYSSNSDFSHSFGSLPIGVGAEIFSWSSLETSMFNATEPHHLEHVDEYLLEHPESFKTSVLEIPASKRKPDLRLTVDTAKDLDRVSLIVRNSKLNFVTTEEAIRLCSLFV